MHDLHHRASTLLWLKSSYSGGSGSECLEAAVGEVHTAVRDSKNPDRATIAFPHSAWADFVGAIRMGRLD
ncbi:DUF397 domain-containing protein [Streptomyces syringium]|uniref:DUF397 domain-containing protein n=1 Tax=Streptomyces syringium TaxID=76729 RepID=UPI00343E8402